MKMLLTLIKLQLNVNFGISALKYRFTKEKKRLWEPVLIGFGIFVGIGSIAFLFTMLMIGLFLGGKSINHPELVLTVAFTWGPLVVFIFGIFYIMSAFYFSKDIDILVPLPIKPYQLLGSKFAVVIINEYLTLIPIIIPALLVYGIGTEQNLLYWLKSVLLFLFSPLLPLTAGALIVVVLMRFVNVRKSKDLLAIIGGMLSLFLGLGINFFVQRIPKGNEGEFFRDMLTKSNFIEYAGRQFPPSIWATYGLSEVNTAATLYFLLFIAVSTAALCLLLWIGDRLFYKSILAGQEVTRRKRSLSENEMDKKYKKQSSMLWALFSREWKLLLRTPVYALNGLAGVIIGPFMVLIMLGSQDTEGKELLSIIMNPEYVVPVSLGGLAFMLFTAGMNIVASTSISREGKSFWISKMIPVSPSQQILSKLLHSLSVSVIGLAVTAAVMAVFLNFSVFRIVILLVLGILGSFLIVALNLLIDVLRPKLEWTNPQEAVKQNMNGFLGILISLAIIVILGAVSVGLIMLNLPEMLIYFLLTVIIIILLALSLWGVFKLAEWRYGRIEV